MRFTGEQDLGTGAEDPGRRGSTVAGQPLGTEIEAGRGAHTQQPLLISVPYRAPGASPNAEQMVCYRWSVETLAVQKAEVTN